MGRSIYVHIGLQKTGTTFLQQNVFPRWPGITFYQYDLPLRAFLSLPKNQKVLISSEGLWYNAPCRQRSMADWWSSFGDPRIVEESIASLREFLPEARILISFRKHSHFILSLYLQYLHEGGTLRFEDFFDCTRDQGFLSRQRISFRHVFEVAERVFRRPPFIFLQEGLRDDLDGTLARMGDYLGCPPPEIRQTALNRSPLGLVRQANRSVGRYQAKVLRTLNRVSKSPHNPNGLLPLRAGVIRRLRLDPRGLCQSGLLAWLLPYRRVVLDEERRRAIDDYFQADWEFIIGKKAKDASMLAS